ncbi:MAG: thiamine diphosphokinase [Clostridia bacterium]|nr:thiamine diphosphokinase [Clostridia bacterium]
MTNNPSNRHSIWPPLSDGPVCVILGAMPITPEEGQDIASIADRFLICADAGVDNARRHGLTADLVLGDFDSLEGGAAAAGEGALTYAVEKDDTDTMLCVKEGLARGYRRFLMYGALGGRLDHTVANITALRYLLDQDAEGWLMSHDNLVTMLQNGTRIYDRDDRYPHFSVFSYDKEAHGVVIKGGKYESQGVGEAHEEAGGGHSLVNSFPLGVSNSIVRDQLELRVRDGVLLVIRAR